MSRNGTEKIELLESLKALVEKTGQICYVYEDGSIAAHGSIGAIANELKGLRIGARKLPR
jgi:hypothetical protein